jgi:hypothetical protein
MKLQARKKYTTPFGECVGSVFRDIPILKFALSYFASKFSLAKPENGKRMYIN